MSNADEIRNATRITVIGVGNGGVNTVKQMISRQLLHAEFICADTDARALARCGACRTLQLGASGLGAANPIRGRQAAELSVDQIRKTIDGAQLLFIIAGMSGGTGTGAAPAIARVGQEMGIQTVGVVTTPCAWEGAKRMRNAEAGLVDLKANADFLIVLPLERLIEKLGDDLTQEEFLAHANDLMGTVVGEIAGMHTWVSSSMTEGDSNLQSR